jgi:molecular chaperone DnaK (HSP70)
MISIEQVLHDSQTMRSDVDEIIMVGGSSRIPKLLTTVSDYFGGKEISKSINADEAVSHGACIQAAILSGRIDDRLRNFDLVDVSPMTLRIETSTGMTKIMIKRNSLIPTKQTEVREPSPFNNRNFLLAQIINQALGYEYMRESMKKQTKIIYSLCFIFLEFQMLEKVSQKYKLHSQLMRIVF